MLWGPDQEINWSEKISEDQSYCLAMPVTVFSPHKKASMATRALNTGEWFRLGLRIGPAPPTGGMYSNQFTYLLVRNSRVILKLKSFTKFLQEFLEITFSVLRKRALFKFLFKNSGDHRLSK